MIKFVAHQDHTNKLIKELAKTNYDAALHWVDHERKESIKKNLFVSKVPTK